MEDFTSVINASTTASAVTFSIPVLSEILLTISAFVILFYCFDININIFILVYFYKRANISTIFE
jgi:hypothetical protein